MCRNGFKVSFPTKKIGDYCRMNSRNFKCDSSKRINSEKTAHEENISL